MSVLIAIIVVLAVILLLIKLQVLGGEKIKFYSTGLDSGFKLKEIRVLWRLAQECDLETPEALYVSVPSLNKCIAKVITDAKERNEDKSFRTQLFLEKLYKFRTRITLDKDGKKGLEDTRSLAKGQRLRLILPGRGVFASRILNNGRELVVELPKQEDKKVKRVHVLPAEEWDGQQINVYLWRKEDACYAFDTTVLGAGVFQAQTCLFLRHSDKLDRTQKRQSVRCSCEIYAQMYVITTDKIDYSVVNSDPGYKCLLEDISEDGAMIRIGGKGKTNAQIKLQFTIADTFIMMFGIIRAVEYNKSLGQSRLHFECTHIEPAMKNAILSYVYNVMPEQQKEINEALLQTEEDSKIEASEERIQLPPQTSIDAEDIDKALE